MNQCPDAWNFRRLNEQPDKPPVTITILRRPVMAKTIQAVRGMNDILPEDTADWHFLEDTLRSFINSYGYHEIRLTLLEKT